MLTKFELNGKIVSGDDGGLLESDLEFVMDPEDSGYLCAFYDNRKFGVKTKIEASLDSAKNRCYQVHRVAAARRNYPDSSAQAGWPES